MALGSCSKLVGGSYVLRCNLLFEDEAASFEKF